MIRGRHQVVRQGRPHQGHSGICPGHRKGSFLALAVCLALTGPIPAVHAASFEDHWARRPELFDPQTGYRIGQQRAPTPDDIPGPARKIAPPEAKALLEAGAVPLDVFGATRAPFHDFDGTWLVSKPRLSLPGAIWLPETGRGRLDATMQAYLTENLEVATSGQKDHPIVVYCIADCWMSWNAAQRVTTLGYREVYWFRLGTDGWLDIGETLVPAEPVLVGVE